MSVSRDVFDVIRERRSVRRFKAAPVPRETIERLLEAASWAPSAGNRQDWQFCAVTSPVLKQAMAAAVKERWTAVAQQIGDDGELAAYAAHFHSFAPAPVIVAVCARKASEAQVRIMGGAALVAGGSLMSAALAAQNLMLAAHALGLGSCCLTGPLAARDELEKMLNIGRRHELACLIMAGFPDENPAAPARKPLSETARFLE